MMKPISMKRTVLALVLFHVVCALPDEFDDSFFSLEFQWRRDRAEAILQSIRTADPEAGGMETMDAIDELGFAIDQAGDGTRLGDSFRARLLSELTVFVQTNAIRALPAPGDPPIPSSRNDLFSFQFCVPRWNGTRFLDERKAAWNGFELSSIAKADLHTVNLYMHDSSRSGDSVKIPAVERAWSELSDMGFVLSFDTDRRLWKITSHDPVGARLNGRIEASKSFLASYRGAISRKDEAEAKRFAEKLDSLGFDLSISNGIPSIASSRRAALLSEIPVPASLDGITLSQYIEAIQNNNSAKTRILSVLKSLSLPSESIRLVDKIWIVDGHIR